MAAVAWQLIQQTVANGFQAYLEVLLRHLELLLGAGHLAQAQLHHRLDGPQGQQHSVRHGLGGLPAWRAL